VGDVFIKGGGLGNSIPDGRIVTGVLLVDNRVMLLFDNWTKAEFSIDAPLEIERGPEPR
jgi:hypothetical protein